MVRFSAAEHRLLQDLAAAQGVALETLIREALALQPIDSLPHLQLVPSPGTRPGRRPEPERPPTTSDEPLSTG